MKRFLILPIMALFSLPMLYGYDTANTTSTTMYTQGPAIEQALHYTMVDTEVQLNLLNPIAEAQFYSAVNEFDVMPATNPATNEFIGAINDAINTTGGLKSTMYTEDRLNLPSTIAKAQFHFDIVTPTDSATNEFIGGSESELALSIPLEHAFNVMTKTDPATEVRLITSTYGMLHMTVQNNTEYIVAGFSSLPIGSNTIVITTDSDLVYSSRGPSPANVSGLIGSNTIASSNSGMAYGSHDYSLVTAQNGELEAGHNRPYC